jgi:hypothetical protein
MWSYFKLFKKKLSKKHMEYIYIYTYIHCIILYSICSRPCQPQIEPIFRCCVPGRLSSYWLIWGCFALCYFGRIACGHVGSHVDPQSISKVGLGQFGFARTNFLTSKIAQKHSKKGEEEIKQVELKSSSVPTQVTWGQNGSSMRPDAIQNRHK